MHLRVLALVALALPFACDKPQPQPLPDPTGGGGGGGGGGDATAASGADGTPVDDGGGETPTPAGGARARAVPGDHPLFGRFEGAGLPNACKADGECFAAGCGGELCSAERGAATTCEVLEVQLPRDAACGCIEGDCAWWSPTGQTLPTPGGHDVPQPNSGQGPKEQLVTCGDKQCKPGQECVGYYGIAGPRGPKFESCEWRCDRKQACPSGTKCTTIADGPGAVCR